MCHIGVFMYLCIKMLQARKIKNLFVTVLKFIMCFLSIHSSEKDTLHKQNRHINNFKVVIVNST